MNKTILIIEDDNFLQGLEATKLKKENYDVLTASNAEQAFKIMNSKDGVSLVLLDLLLPESNGFEILKKIRESENSKNLPVIVFSNLSEEKDIEQANKLGISGFMVKSNFTLDELTQRIKEVIG